MNSLTEAVALGGSSYGVVVDDVGAAHGRSDLSRIGLLAAFEEGALSMDVVDAAIALDARLVETFVEVPGDMDIPDLALLLRDCSKMKIGLCLLPPAAEGAAGYVERLADCARIFCGQQNHERPVLPVTGIMRGLYAKAANPGADLSNDDAFDGYPGTEGWGAVEAAARSRVEDEIVKAFGGRSEFDSHVAEVLAEMRAKVEFDVAMILGQAPNP